MLKIEMSLPDINEIKKRNLKKWIDMQNVLTLECKKAADFYTPMQSGDLKNNFEYDKDIKTGAFVGWVYKMVYATRQWFGLTEAGQPFNYSKDANPQAQSRWTEKAIVEKKKEIWDKIMAVLLG